MNERRIRKPARKKDDIEKQKWKIYYRSRNQKIAVFHPYHCHLFPGRAKVEAGGILKINKKRFYESKK